MIVSFFIDNLIIQGTVFVISSTILIFATKPFVTKFAKNTPNLKTNAYSIIEKTAIVTQDINSIDGTGQVKVDGEIWSAIGENSSNIPKGTKVKILEIKGVKVIVTPV